ncbi:PF09950 family protein [Leptospira weilii serovar Topaz str. LT2116]|uniref:PF09950 family protein n=1 Tax=Leptospira weilii serovar Topaz str. LT2116 TaxID=1088540 RepID=M3FPB7_9LEPT|nr:PF09950 family protein [Leptospira weilii serovar Topaz str. LT2116]
MTPKKEELKLRKIARVKADFPSYAREIGYDVDNGEGGAVVTAAGAKPKDIPFVNESVERVIQPAVDFITAISYTEDEIEAAMAKRLLGKGPAYPLDQRRVEKARRYVSEKEDYTGFNGNKALKVPGIVTSAGYKVEGPNFASLATAKAMLDELHRGKTVIEKDDVFKARTLMLTPEDKGRLLKPLNDYTSITLFEWFKANGLYFDNILTSTALRKENNVLNRDLFLVLDSDPEVLELAVLKDITLGKPVTDYTGETKMVVTERFGGSIVYYPEGIYVGMQEVVAPELRMAGLETEPKKVMATGVDLSETKPEPVTGKSKEVSKAKGKPTSSEKNVTDASQSGTDAQ